MKTVIIIVIVVLVGWYIFSKINSESSENTTTDSKITENTDSIVKSDSTEEKLSPNDSDSLKNNTVKIPKGPEDIPEILLKNPPDLSEDEKKMISFGDRGAVSDLYFKAMDGDTHSMIILGHVFSAQVFNYEKAFVWYTLADRAGDIDAPYCLGQCYLHGWWVEENIDKAMTNIVRSAKKGSRIAVDFLGENFSKEQIKNMGISI